MSIKARLKRLEKKVVANEPPMREIGVFAGKPIWKTEERDGVMHFVPIMSDEEYAIFARNQQDRLLREIAEYEAQLDNEGNTNVVHSGPNETGEAPLIPGQRRANYVFVTQGGRDYQINVATKEKIAL